MYVGYCLPTTSSYDDPTWLIRRVKKTINEDGSYVQTIMYPNTDNITPASVVYMSNY